jgi:hypothetical protein
LLLAGQVYLAPLFELGDSWTLLPEACWLMLLELAPVLLRDLEMLLQAVVHTAAPACSATRARLHGCYSCLQQL